MTSFLKTKEDASARHVWHFVKLGGFDQVTLKSGSDLVSLDQLDQKLWAALSCPANGLEFDDKTLALIDTNGDGRIRAPEIIAAAKWAGSLLKNPDDLMTGAESLPLSAIDDKIPEGREILSSAREILSNLGKQDAAVITPEDTADRAKIFAETQFNGDGIVPVDSADDEVTGDVIKDIIACLGPEDDRSGAPGVSREKVNDFFTEAEAYDTWWKLSESDAENVLPYGDKTEDAATIFNSIRGKVNDYFTRCRLVEFDPDAVEALNPSKGSLEALSSKDLSVACDEEMAALPLAAIEAKKPLPLKSGVNPAWIEVITKFSTEIVTPLFGETVNLGANEWNEICARFAAYEKWQKQKEGTAVESLGIERVREILDSDGKAALETLIQKDEALAPQAEGVSSVDRLVRYYRDLYRLLNNFVSLSDFYTPNKKSVFQAGTLYLDARSCELCVKVDDLNKHSALAQLSQTYLAYCECTRKETNEKLTIAAAFTNGSSDNLRVGRNGLFYDRKGCDWDAVIVKLIEHPISLRQAFWSPYRRISQFISAQIAKMTSARDEQMQANVSKSLTGVLKEPGQKKGTDQGFDIAKFAGVFAAIGLAVGAIGTALASMVTGFIDLSWWEVPLAIAGIILLISGPSVINGYLNLRRRNLGPILDACGWAVNTRAKINIPFGATLTRLAILPPDSRRSLKKDPYGQKKRSWKFYAVLLVTLAAAVFLFFFYYSKDRDGWPPIKDSAVKSVEEVKQQDETLTKPPQKK
ncbi:MAG: hypothetical protein K9N10_01660 [Deltaproteobacteria bacterium]|nr:hypothetical protein [Deltaproteobacteria bacterium]